MNSIKYVTGDATCPDGSGKRVIAHVCNNVGAFGAGFAAALERRWLKCNWISKAYKNWEKTGKPVPFELGNIIAVNASPNSELIVVHMLAQNGLPTRSNPRPACLRSLEMCLEKLAKYAAGAGMSIHMPKICTGFGGVNDWREIENLIELKLCSKDIPVTIYTLQKE